MTCFKIITKEKQEIRFEFYLEAAPVTSKAFASILPFTKTFYHARVSGQEIWTSGSPNLNIIQENSSVFTEVGEVVLGPVKPVRAKTANCMGIYYGEGKGLDSCNIFAKVLDEDIVLLKELGEKIWKDGQQNLTFQISD